MVRRRIAGRPRPDRVVSGPASLPSAVATNPHAGETMILQAQVDADKTVIIQAPTSPPPAAPAVARKPPPDVDISL